MRNAIIYFCSNILRILIYSVIALVFISIGNLFGGVKDNISISLLIGFTWAILNDIVN